MSGLGHDAELAIKVNDFGGHRAAGETAPCHHLTDRIPGCLGLLLGQVHVRAFSSTAARRRETSGPISKAISAGAG
jgi:hypothetical protein